MLKYLLTLAGVLLASPVFAADIIALDGIVLRPMIEVDVPARQTGVLATIAIDEGAIVAQGDLLAALDDRAARLAVEKSEVERDQAAAKAANEIRIRYADKALEVARAELKRSSEAIREFARTVSQSQIDVERLTVQKLELEREQAEHDVALEKFALRLTENALETAQHDLELHAVRAPFTGVVATVYGRAGEWVQPGAKVLRLVAIDALRAEGFIAATDVTGLKPGSPVEFAVDGATPGAAVKLTGVLRFVSPEMDPVNKQVRVWAEIKNTDRQVRPGQQGQLRLSK